MTQGPMLPLTRYTLALLAALATLPLAGPLLDLHAGDPQPVLGRINNLAAAWAIAFFLGLPAAFRHLDTSPERRLFGLICALLLYGLVYSAFVTENMVSALGGLGILIGGVSAGYLCYAAARNGADMTRAIAMCVVSIAVFLPIPPILISLAPDAFGDFTQNVHGYGNIRAYGFFCTGVITALAFFLQSASLPLRKHALIAAALLICWTCFFWSGTRAGLLAIGIGLPVAALFLKKRSVKGWLTVAITAAAGALTSLAIHTPNTNFGLVNRIEKSASVFTPVDGATSIDAANAATSGRLEMWSGAWSAILEKPLTGYGFFAQQWATPDHIREVHTHNIFLEYWLSLGFIIGSLPLIIGAALLLKAMIRARSSQRTSQSATAGLCVVLAIYANGSGILFLPFHLYIFCAGLGAILGFHSAAAGGPPHPSANPSKDPSAHIFIKESVPE